MELVLCCASVWLAGHSAEHNQKLLNGLRKLVAMIRTRRRGLCEYSESVPSYGLGDPFTINIFISTMSTEGASQSTHGFFSRKMPGTAQAKRTRQTSECSTRPAKTTQRCLKRSSASQALLMSTTKMDWASAYSCQQGISWENVAIAADGLSCFTIVSTALHYAASAPAPDTLEMLLEHEGTDVDCSLRSLSRQTLRCWCLNDR